MYRVILINPFTNISEVYIFTFKIQNLKQHEKTNSPDYYYHSALSSVFAAKRIYTQRTGVF